MDRLKAAPVPLLLAGLIAFLATVVPGLGANAVRNAMYNDPFNQPGLVLNLVLNGAFSLVTGIIGGLGLIPLRRMALNVTSGREAQTSDISDMTHFGPAAITVVLVTVISSIGTVLCFLPGLIASFFLWNAVFIALDKGVSPIDAMKQSVTMTANGAVALGTFVFGLIAVVGAIACCVGLIATFPLAVLGSAYIYRAAERSGALNA